MSFIEETTRVIENVPMARDTYRLRLHSPEMARRFLPGQFLMLRWRQSSDPLLGRPFALYDTVLDANGQPEAFDIGYVVVGKQTRLLATLRPGDAIEAWGPLGNGFPELPPAEHVGLVAGGIGQTPFLAYTRQILGTRGYGRRTPQRSTRRVSLYYGVRTAELAACIDDFRAAGAEVHLASDDGSLGFRGFVTQLLEQHSPPQQLLGCGPEPMMHALSRLAARWNVPCHLSLESPMACGVGICFSCVTKVATPDGWDYKRVCVEGPVFDAAKLVWDR
jgi:dihydroorotate dehydrogenase electron transfer subunit